jgi:hypothetical protein
VRKYSCKEEKWERKSKEDTWAFPAPLKYSTEIGVSWPAAKVKVEEVDSTGPFTFIFHALMA